MSREPSFPSSMIKDFVYFPPNGHDTSLHSLRLQGPLGKGISFIWRLKYNNADALKTTVLENLYIVPAILCFLMGITIGPKIIVFMFVCFGLYLQHLLTKWCLARFPPTDGARYPWHRFSLFGDQLLLLEFLFLPLFA